MSKVERRRGGGTAPSLRLTPGIVVALFGGCFLGVLAFSQTAASTGITIDTFRPLGGSFFSWRNGQLNLAVDLHEGRKKIQPDQLIKSGQSGLNYAPLSARSLWMVGKGFEAQKRPVAAHAAMVRAEKITRRDAAVQLWLADYNLKLGKVASALTHYDLIIRANPDASVEILPRLSVIMTVPQARPYLQPYVRASNPWFEGLLRTAVDTVPKAEPIGRLLVEHRTKVPNTPELEPIYARLVGRLVDEGAQDVALQLYPMLPNGGAAALTNVSGIVDGKAVAGYPPFIWSFANDAYGASLVGLDSRGAGMEFYGAPGTIGMAATKLIAPRGNTHLRWRVFERSPNMQSSASWVATCVAGRTKGAVQKSTDLMAQTVPLNAMLSMPLPENCNVVRLDMRIAGGIGINPASLIVGSLALNNGSAKK